MPPPPCRWGTQVSCSPRLPGKAGRDARAGGLTPWTLLKMGLRWLLPNGSPRHGLAAITGADPDPTEGVRWLPRGAQRGDSARRNRDHGSRERSGSDAGLQRVPGTRDPQVHSSPPPRRFPSCRPHRPEQQDERRHRRSPRVSHTCRHRAGPVPVPVPAQTSRLLCGSGNSCISSQQRRAPRCSPIPSPAGWAPLGCHVPGITGRGAGGCGAEQPAGRGRSRVSRCRRRGWLCRRWE